MNNMNGLILAAAAAGMEAFKRGAKSIPVQDPALWKLLELSPNDCLPLLKAWDKAWHDANLCATIPSP